ncbi:MAG: response regulator transcription factor [Lachnospiraceae bacterium]|nr:response regulator transcription factor [Lachnospiraceae bacterium]
MGRKILLIEDDYALAMGTEYALQAEGYTVLHASNLANARIALKEEPDLILLDVMLPDGNGFDFCREVRTDNIYVPIIFLTAVGEEVNIVQGLEFGADDYITKPYRVKELLSRIAANIRRYRMQQNVGQSNTYAFGMHEFLIDEFRLQCNGANIECTPSELRLLKELILHEGQVLTRNQLLERLYDTGENFIDDNTLSVYMKRLRDRLGTDADWIETVRGVGYRFKKRGI